MKIFEVKSIVFSLFAILVLSVFMTSCEQEIELPDVTEQTEIVSETSSADSGSLEDRWDNCYWRYERQERGSCINGRRAVYNVYQKICNHGLSTGEYRRSYSRHENCTTHTPT